jgi:hypothetical protein
VPKLFAALKYGTRKDWWRSFIWLVFTVIGGLVPLWGGWIILNLFGRQVSWFDFVRHGEFALYAAAFITPAFYLISKEATGTFPQRQFLLLVGLMGLLVATVIFAGVTAAIAPSSGGPLPSLNEQFLSRSSWILLVFSLIYAFAVTLTDTIRTQTDPQRIAREQQVDLERSFDDLGEGDGGH